MRDASVTRRTRPTRGVAARGRPGTGLVGALLGAATLLLAIVLTGGPSGAQVTASITVHTGALVGGEVPLLDPGATFAQNRAAVQDAIAAETLDGRVLLLPGTIATPDEITVTVATGEILFDDATRSVALPSTVTLSGAQVDVLLLAQWVDDASFTPEVSVGLYTGQISLPDWGLTLPTVAPVLPDTWIALSTGAQDLTPFTTTPTGGPAPLASFYPQGFTLPVGPAASWLSTLVLDSAIGSTTAQALGYPDGTLATLTGTIGFDPAILSGEVGGTDIALQAAVPAAQDALIGGWLRASAPWTISLRHTVGADAVVFGLTGQLEPGDASPLAGAFPAVDVTGALTYVAGDVATTLTGVFVDTDCAGVDFTAGSSSCWADAFDYGWLDLTGVVMTATFAQTDGVPGASIAFESVFDPDGPDPTTGDPNVQPLGMDFAVQFAVGRITADVVVSRPANDPLSMADVATLFAAQGTSGATFPGQDLLGLRDVTFAVEVGLDADPDLANATFTLTARTTVMDAVEVDVLVGLTRTLGDEPLILLGIRTSDVSLARMFAGSVGALEGTALGELTMPGVDYSIAFPISAVTLPDPLTVTAEDLGRAARAFYNQDVGLLHIEAGLSIRGTADVASLGQEFLETFSIVPDADGQALLDYSGAVTGTFDWGNGAGATVDLTTLDLTGDLAAAVLPVPGWLEQQLQTGVSLNGLSARFSYADGVGYRVGLQTTLQADIDDTGTVEDVAIEVSVSYDDIAEVFSTATTGLIGVAWVDGAPVGPWTWVQPFGADITIAQPAMAFTFTTGPPPTATAVISGTLPVGPATVGVHAGITLAGTALSADLRLDLSTAPDTPIIIGDVVGLAAAQIDPALAVGDGELNELLLRSGTIAMHLGADPTFLLQAVTTYRDVDTDVLLTVDRAADVVAALHVRPTSAFTLSQLDDAFSGPYDLALPDLTIVVATAPLEAASTDVDPAVQTFFAPVHGCDPGDLPACAFDLSFAEGVTVMASVPLPEDLAPAESALGIDPDARIVLKGFVPLFGAAGQAEPSLEALLPPFTPPGSPEWFVAAQLSFVVTPSSFGLAGAMEVLMDDEHLLFTIAGAVDAGPPATLVLKGSLTTERPWVQPFGVGWLTINTLNLELGLTGGTVTIGFRGDVVIEDKDIDASILIAIGPGGVPTLLGIRGASAAGFTLTELATFQADVAAASVGAGGAIDIGALTDGLPQMSLRNIEFSYSTITNADLCLQPGIIFGGEMFINPIGSAPADDAEGGGACTQVAARPDASAFCLQNRVQGCFASMRVEVDEFGILAKGSIPGLTLGTPEVLILGDSLVDIVADLTTTSMTVAGSARIPGPGVPENFVSGELTLQISRTGRAFEGDFKVFDAFFAYVDGSLQLSEEAITQPFNGDIANFTIHAVMRADFASAVSGIIEPVIAEVDRVYEVVQPMFTALQNLSSDPNPIGVLGQVPGQLRALGVEPPQVLVDIVGAANDVQTVIDDATAFFVDAGVPLDAVTTLSPLELIDAALKGYQFPAGFPGVDVPFIPEICITTFRGPTCYSVPPIDAVYVTVCAPWPWDDECGRVQVTPYIPGVPGVITPEACIGAVIGDTCYLLGLVPFDFPGIPGLCEVVLGISPDDPDCGIDALISSIVNPLLVDVLADAIGVDPDITLPSIQTILTRLADVFADGGTLFSIDCAEFDADIGALQESNTVGLGVAVTVLGNPFGLQVDWSFGPNPADAAYSLVKVILTNVLTGEAMNRSCAGQAPGEIIPPPSNLVLTAPNPIAENTTYGITGTFSSDAASPHTVGIEWGDGTRTDLNLPAGTLDFPSTTHHFLDDNPTATPSDTRFVRVTVTNAATGAAVTRTTQVRIDNVAPSDLIVDVASAIAEADTVTLTGSFLDSGVGDAHAVDVSWGDRTAVATATLPANVARDPGARREFTFTHTYADDNPTATSSDSYTIEVSVTDDDTGQTSLTRPIVVADVAPVMSVVYTPTALVAQETDADGLVISQTFESLPAGDDGTITIDEGRWVTVDGTFIDPGASDTHEVVINWGEGDLTTIGMIDGERAFQARHRYGDDNPTTTSSDPYTITVTLVDDDSLGDDSSQDIVVANVVPHRVELGFGQLTVDENDVVELEGSFLDAGLADTHTVRVDWGDGNPVDDLVLEVGQRDFAFAHRYLDDDPTDTPVDSYTLSVELFDDDSGQAVQADMVTTFNEVVLVDGRPDEIPDPDNAGQTILRTEKVSTQSRPVAIIADVPAEVAFEVTPTVGGTAQIDENETVTLQGSFIDPGTLDDWTIVIDWGDGSAHDVTTVQATPGRAFDIPIPFGPIDHQYLDDDPTQTNTDVYTVTVTVTDDDTLSGQTTRPVRVDNVLPTIEAGGDQFVFEDDLVSLDPATFGDAGTVDSHTASIAWGDGTDIDVVTVTEYAGSAGRHPEGADGTLDADHRYASPGIYRATLCIADDDDRRNPVCDTFEVTVIHSFLKFAAFGDRNATTVAREARVEGAVGGNLLVRLSDAATTTGMVVSVEGDVILQRRSSAGGDLVAGRDARLASEAAVSGSIDVGRRVVRNASATVGGPIVKGPAAYRFPEVTWADLDTTPGTLDVRARRTTVLAPGDHGRVTLQTGSLVVGSGLYRLESLAARPRTAIQIDLTADEAGHPIPIVVEIAEGMTLGREVVMEITGGAPTDVLFLVAGHRMRLGQDGTFVGTFISDDDEARLDRGATLTGALYGARARVERGAVIISDPALHLWADHIVTNRIGDVGDVLMTVDAGADQQVFEDDVVTLDPAIFDDRGIDIAHRATIDWGDGILEEGVVDEDASTVRGQHVYAAPGVRVVTVCVFDDPGDPASCQQDTLVVTVLSGFLRFGVYGDSSTVDVKGGAIIEGGLGGNDAVRVADDASVSGRVISIDGNVDLGRRVSVTGDVTAATDVDLDRDARVEGDVDAGRRLDADSSAVVTGEVRTGPDAVPFPAVTWRSVDVVGGASSQNLRGASTLAPGIYGDVRVDDGTLVLQAGVYRLRSLEVRRDTQIMIDLDPDGDGVAGEVVFEVEKDVTLDRGTTMSITSAVGAASNLLVLAGSSIRLDDGGTYLGTFVSGGGTAELGRAASLVGGLYGRSVQLEDDARVTARPALDLYARQVLGR